MKKPKPATAKPLPPATGSEMELLQRVLGAWYLGIKQWQMTHDSMPTAFASLAHVMDDVQTAVKTKSQNAKVSDE